MQPSVAQMEAYRRDGFLVVEGFLERAEVDRVRERFTRVFEHERETGLQPDEINYVPASPRPISPVSCAMSGNPIVYWPEQSCHRELASSPRAWQGCQACALPKTT
jgi:Phytanoyl-CoA dioxygenase (PhyH)